VKRAENLITGLTGVLSARIVVTPLGEVSEIHVLTTSDVQPKQVVRNVESALMAQLGMKLDHRKISVAQTAEVRPIEALDQQEAISARAKRRVVVFQNPSCGRRTAAAVQCASSWPTGTGRRSPRRWARTPCGTGWRRRLGRRRPAWTSC
jgi:hypothetical protein